MYVYVYVNKERLSLGTDTARGRDRLVGVMGGWSHIETERQRERQRGREREIYRERENTSICELIDNAIERFDLAP